MIVKPKLLELDVINVTFRVVFLYQAEYYDDHNAIRVWKMNDKYILKKSILHVLLDQLEGNLDDKHQISMFFSKQNLT